VTFKSLEQAITEAIMDRDQEKLSMIMMHAGLTGRTDEALVTSKRILDAAPHEIQHWWNQDCNCDGHLN
jgi:hypothetical protein